MVGAVVASTAGVAAQAPRLEDVLARAGAYLSVYQAQMASVAADEVFEQRYRVRNGSTTVTDERRTLRSDFIFLQLPGNNHWLGMRDSFSLNGTPLRERLQRMEASIAAGEMDVASRIVADNIRHNLGGVNRNVNVPVQTLEVLLDAHRSRFNFAKNREERIDGRLVWKVAFDERQRPTLVTQPDGGNVVSRGFAWLDPRTGVVVRTQLALDEETARGVDLKVARIVVTYQHDAGMRMLVPIEMTERYEATLSVAKTFELTTRARYSAFRRFETSARLISR
jgi:hypothetical protein